MRFAAPGTVRLDDRPPVATDIAPLPGAALRVTAQERFRITPRLWPEHLCYGVEPSHPYVLTYWTAALGPNAVSELLRLIMAAKRRSEVPHPVFLSVFCREGLVHFHSRAVWVRPLLPPIGRHHVGRLTPRLRQQHRRDLLSVRYSRPAASTGGV
ncbi:MAG: hypothetical protein OXK16_14430 [bacterium]|nr:hypothetical protein [bacterium]